MKLYYHKDPEGNFGDDLNPWLWNRLLPDMFDGDFAHDPRHRTSEPDGSSLFVGIGTLLNQNIPPMGRKAIFATGTGYGGDPKRDDSWHVYCVRGPRTAEKLGLSPDAAVTDGAALVSTIGLPRSENRIPVAFMPHVSTARSGYWRDACAAAGVHYLDPQGTVEEVFDQLLATDLLLAEAMHGAILADTLRIPWIPITTTPLILNFKWADWCESLEMTYEPVKFPSLWGSIEETSWPRKGLKIAKCHMAKQALRKTAAHTRPMLSKDSVFNNRVEELQARLDSFREDFKRGEYAA